MNTKEKRIDMKRMNLALTVLMGITTIIITIRGEATIFNGVGIIVGMIITSYLATRLIER